MEREDKFILRWAKRYRATQELGGKCSKCGEDDIFVLDFHHTNPEEKEYGISKVSAHIEWSKLKKELDKCILLCRNCHSKHHIVETEKKFFENFGKIKEKAKIVDKISKPKLDDEFIYSLLKKKCSLNEISKVLKKDVSTIRDIAIRLEEIHKEKLFLRREEYNNKKEKITDSEIIKMCKKGIEVVEICKKFKISKSTLYPRIKKLKEKQLI